MKDEGYSTHALGKWDVGYIAESCTGLLTQGGQGGPPAPVSYKLSIESHAISWKLPTGAPRRWLADRGRYLPRSGSAMDALADALQLLGVGHGCLLLQGGLPQLNKCEGRQVGPEVGPTSAFYTCTPTGMHGPACIFWANLTPFSLQRDSVHRAARAGDRCRRPRWCVL